MDMQPFQETSAKRTWADETLEKASADKA